MVIFDLACVVADHNFVVSFRNIFVLVSRVAESTLTVSVFVLCFVWLNQRESILCRVSWILPFTLFIFSLPLSHTETDFFALLLFSLNTKRFDLLFHFMHMSHTRTHKCFFLWYPLRFDIVIELLFDSFRWFCTFDLSVVGVVIVVAAKAATQRQQHQPQILLIVRPLNYT